jgi:hypothetical protein
MVTSGIALFATRTTTIVFIERVINYIDARYELVKIHNHLEDRGGSAIPRYLANREKALISEMKEMFRDC